MVSNLEVLASHADGGWVMSNGSQDSQKVCTKLLSLPDNAKKPNF